MKISVVIPCHNEKGYIERCLSALLAQTVSPDEVIVVDDGSTDGSPEIASRFPVKLIRVSARRGIGCARNLGVRHAIGDVIVFVDADVVLPQRTIERFVEHFRSDDSVAGVGGRYVNLGKGWFDRYLSRYHGGTFAGGCSAFRRTALLKLDLPPKIGYAVDVWTRKLMEKAGYKLVADEEIFGYHLRAPKFRHFLRRMALGAYYSRLMSEEPKPMVGLLKWLLAHSLLESVRGVVERDPFRAVIAPLVAMLCFVGELRAWISKW